jgi:hypothetical protein
MLERISYIDECDTLGQKAEEKKIHKVSAHKVSAHKVSAHKVSAPEALHQV